MNGLDTEESSDDGWVGGWGAWPCDIVDNKTLTGPLPSPSPPYPLPPQPPKTRTFSALPPPPNPLHPLTTPPTRWLQWTSFIKFTFQPLAMNALRGTSIESVIETIAINTPPSISANLLCGLGIFSALTLGGYLALRHLHKEKR